LPILHLMFLQYNQKHCSRTVRSPQCRLMPVNLWMLYGACHTSFEREVVSLEIFLWSSLGLTTQFLPLLLRLSLCRQEHSGHSLFSYLLTVNFRADKSYI
jgi:hypothetical protein